MPHRIVLFVIVLVSLTVSCNFRRDADDQIRQLPTQNDFVLQNQLLALTEAIRNDPENDEVYYQRARVYMNTENYESALADIKKAASLNGSQGKYYLLMAKIYRALGKPHAALRAVQYAQKLNLDSPELWVATGSMYYLLHRYDTALVYLAQAQAVSPYDPEAFYYKGAALAETGDTTSALANLTSAVRYDRAYIDAYNKLISIYLAKHRHDDAFRCIRLAVQIAPKDPFLNYHAGLYYYQRNVADSAQNFLKKAIFFDPTLYLAHYSLGQLSYAARNYLEANTHFANAVKYNPQYTPALYYQALTCEYTGQTSLAINIYNNLIARNSEYAKQASEALERIQLKMEERRKAEEAAVKDTIN